MKPHRIHEQTGADSFPMVSAVDGRMTSARCRYLEEVYRDDVGFVMSYDPTKQTEAEAMAEFAEHIARPESQAEAEEEWKRKYAKCG